MLLNKKSPHGGDIYSNQPKVDFSANINPAGMPEAVRQALKDAIDKCQVYPDPYCTVLREKIAVSEHISENMILCGNGAAELIYSFAFTLPKDKPALIVAPTFCEYEQALKAAEISMEYYMLKKEDDFRLTEEILHTDLKNYSAVFLCSPNNPTGITVQRELLQTIAQTGVRLFCDFCFLDLTDMPEQYNIPALLTAYPNVMILRAFTKSYAMAGVRLGYVMCKDREVLAKMSDTQTPQGILCIVEQKKYDIEELLNIENPHFMVLDNLQDPGNLGTIVRTAEGAGVDAIFLSKESVDIYNPKTIRSTMGSIYRMPVIYVDDLLELLNIFKQRGIKSYAAHLEGKKSYDKEDYQSGTAILIGNEGNGLRDEVAENADVWVQIPMQGKVESLNAAIAASILMFEVYRQRR